MTNASPSDPLIRRLGSAGLGAALIGAAAWLAWRNLSLPVHDGWIFWVPLALCLVSMGLLWWWTALVGQQPAGRRRIRASWRSGWVVGAVGFALGFLGPLVVAPKGSLGPLLGILLTGPLGFVVGALVAATTGLGERST